MQQKNVKGNSPGTKHFAEASELFNHPTSRACQGQIKNCQNIFFTKLLAVLLIYFKGIQAGNFFFFAFFAETETLWSQGPVTRNF